MTIREALQFAIPLLERSKIDSAFLDAESLLAHVLKQDRAFVLARGEYALLKEQEREYKDLIKKRSEHVPFAYLIGTKEFYGHEFAVNKYTLIPRPETELLVEATLAYLKKDESKKFSLLDVGTGSGCIIIALALHAKNLGKLMAIDRVKRALDVAKQNAEKHELGEHILFKRYNMISLIKERFDIIVANLPYLSPKEISESTQQNPELGWEPQIALLGGKDGLLFIRQLISQTRKHLNPGGALFLEIGDMQAEEVKKIAEQELAPCEVEIKKDLCHRDRVVVIRT